MEQDWSWDLYHICHPDIAGKTVVLARSITWLRLSFCRTFKGQGTREHSEFFVGRREADPETIYDLCLILETVMSI